jgi:sulfonate transport system permease protein
VNLLASLIQPKGLAEAGGDASPRRPRSPSRDLLERFALGVALPTVGLALWEVAVHYGIIEGRLMPPPSRIARVFWELAASGELFRHIEATMGRVVVGFACGAIAGSALGAVSGAIVMVRGVIDPTIQALRAIPSIAWVPLFILWFGIFEASKITLIAVGVFFPVYLGVMGAIMSVDRKLIEVGRIFRLSPLALTLRILLPAVLPAWIVALRTGLGLGFMFVVAAELMGASEGLGYLLLDGQQIGRPDEILVALMTFAILGQASDRLLVGVTRPLLAWQDTDRRPF